MADKVTLRRNAFWEQSLSYLVNDPTGMHELRQQLYEAGWHYQVTRLTDTEVLEEVGRLLQSGELRFIEEETVEIKKTGGGAIAPAGAAAPAAVSPPPPRQAAPQPDEVPDPDTLPPNLDAATQAATLQAAAAQGAPFCPT